MEQTKLIALTFDDGPSNITEKVLDILEEQQITGTFFLIGERILPETKPILERQLSLHCELANHSFTHRDMSQMSPDEIREEIAKTSALILDTASVEPRFFRPPYIALSDTMYENISLPFICGEDSVDWNPEVSAKERINNVLQKAEDGSIILMHDMKDNDRTLEALPAIIDGLKERGFSFVTVSRLFELKNIDPYKPHKLWSNVLK